MEEYITRPEHEEYAKRMQDEHTRQNRRISILEEKTEENNKLLLAIERLTSSIKNMQEELKNQGDRLNVLESRDGEMWRKVVSHVITTAIGILVGLIFTKIGM